MAKISKLNVSITGDSSGLAAATDKATSHLRRLRMEQERTSKRIGAMRSTVNQTAESLSKLGVANRGVGALGGVLGIAGLGGTGLALAGAGAAFAAVTSGITTVGAAVDGMNEERKKAFEALKILRRNPWRTPEEFGFSQRALDNLTREGIRPQVLAERGFLGGMQLGLAEGPKGREFEQLAQLTPFTQTGRGIIGQTVGGILGGKGVDEAARDAVSQGMRDVFAPAGVTGETSGNLAAVFGLYNTLSSWWSK